MEIGTLADPDSLLRLLESFRNISTLKGGQGRDTLRGLDANASFILDDNARYLSGGRTLYFSGLESLVGGKGNDRFEIHGEQTYDLHGGAGDDTFVFADGAKLNGELDGQGGADTVDFGAYLKAIDIILSSLGESGFNGIINEFALGSETGLLVKFANIDNLIGSSSTDKDRLTGLDAEVAQDGKATFVLDTNPRYLTGSYVLAYSGIETLVGGSTDDRFEIHGERAFDLYGGAGNDTFVFLNKAKLNGSIDGQGGKNTLDYSAYTTPIEIILFGVEGIDSYGDGNVDTINGFKGTVTGALSGEFTNITHFIGSKASGDSLRGMEEASSWTLDGDKITYTNNVIKSILENANIEDTTDSIRISVVGIEILKGNNAGDTFTISGTVPYSLVGGTGDDIFRLLNNAKLQGNINGGAGEDSFIFEDKATLQGSLDGGEGQDTLDFSAYQTARNIVLTAVGKDGFTGKEGAITAGFANIDNLIGSSANNDRLTGLDTGATHNGKATFVLDSNPRYLTGSYELTFDGIENLYGGSANDLFEIHGIGGQHSYKLYGGAGDDTFKFIGAAELDGTIDGGSGVNTLDYSSSDYKDNEGNNIGVKVDLSEGSATSVSGGAKDKVQNISNLIGSAYDDTLIGNDRDNVIIGGQGNDRLEGRGGYNTYIFEEDWGIDQVINSSGQGMLDLSALGADWHLIIDLTAKIITVNSSLPEIANNGIDFDGISHIRSGAGNDEFIISNRQKMDLEGGNGEDTFKFVGIGILEGIIDGGTGDNTLDYSGYATAVTFNLATMNATGLNGFTNIHKLIGSDSNGDGDTIRGANADSRYEITAENAGKITWNITLGGQEVEYYFEFEGIENLIGGTGKDTFAIIGQGSLTGSIDGGAGSNTLDYSEYDKGDNTGVKVDLSEDQRSATAIGKGEPGMISNIQNVVSSPYDDELIGHETESNTFIFEDDWGNDKLTRAAA